MNGFLYINKFNDIFVLKEFQDFDLAQDPFGINHISKSSLNLFDGNVRLGKTVVCGVNYTVCATSNHALHRVPLVHSHEGALDFELTFAFNWRLQQFCVHYL